MAENSTTPVATIPFVDLPESTAQTGLQMVAVRDEEEVVRVPWSQLTATSLHVTSQTPGAYSGSTGDVYISEGAVWVCDALGNWGVLPRFVSAAAQGDTTSTTRFLRVDVSAEYTQAEKENARGNLGISVASVALGLVRDSSTSPAQTAPVRVSNDGAMYVQEATPNRHGAVRIARAGQTGTPDDDDVVTHSWLQAKFSGLGVDENGKLKVADVPRASYTSVGCVMPSEDHFVQNSTTGKLEARIASYGGYGVTKVIDYATWSGYSGNPPSQEATPTLEVVNSLVGSAKAPYADESSYGTVKLSAMLKTNNAGALEVKNATAASKGVVSVTTSPAGPTGDSSNVLSTDATYSYVTQEIQEAMASYSGRIATYSEPGYLRPSSDQMTLGSNGAFSVKLADDGTYGLVRVYSSPIAQYTGTDWRKVTPAGTAYAIYSGLTNAVSDLESSVNGSLATLQGNVTSLQASVTQLLSTVAALSTRLDGMEAAIASLDERVSALEGN